MKTVWIAVTSVLFVGAFALGLFVGSSMRGESPAAQATRTISVEQADSPGVVKAGGSSRAGVRATRKSRARVAAKGRPETAEDGADERRSRVDALAALQTAVKSGDEQALRRALDDLGRPGGEQLSSEDLSELASYLGKVDGNDLERLARALIESGGAEGAALAMSFVEDPDQALHDRERVLRGLSRVSREHAEEVLPVLADFLESDAPRALQHSAARGIGRLFGEDGTDVLLGLLDERPGAPRSAIFDAIGDTGKPEDAAALLDLLDGDWSRRDRMDLLRSVVRISSREEGESGAGMLEMLRDPPEGVSKSMVADAISHSSHHLDPSVLRAAMLEVSGDGRAQESLARAVAENGGRAGLEALFEMARDPDYNLDSRALAHALHDVSSTQAVPWMMDLIRGSGSEEVMESLARGVFRGGQKESMADLMGLLSSGNERQRMAIAHSLREADRSSLDMGGLMDVLRSERHPDVGRELARSITSKFGDRGVQEIGGLLRASTETDRRGGLMWGLEGAWRRESTEARSLIADLARNDPAPDLRRQAIHILQRHGDESLVPTFQDLLRSEADPEVQERIREAISELGEGR